MGITIIFVCLIGCLGINYVRYHVELSNLNLLFWGETLSPLEEQFKQSAYDTAKLKARTSCLIDTAYFAICVLIIVLGISNGVVSP